MSAQLDQTPAKPLTFRRYKDGDTKPHALGRHQFSGGLCHQ